MYKLAMMYLHCSWLRPLLLLSFFWLHFLFPDVQVCPILLQGVFSKEECSSFQHCNENMQVVLSRLVHTLLAWVSWPCVVAASRNEQDRIVQEDNLTHCIWEEGRFCIEPFKDLLYVQEKSKLGVEWIIMLFVLHFLRQKIWRKYVKMKVPGRLVQLSLRSQNWERKKTYSIEGAPWNPIHISHLKPYRVFISSKISFLTSCASSERLVITSFALTLSPLFNKVPRFDKTGSGFWIRGRIRKWKMDFG